MATRTSHSSPCFLRVAEASAASRASKITSLSTPFSLETASTTIRISLFITHSSYIPRARHRLSRCQPRLRNLTKLHFHTLPVDLQGHAGCRNFLQHSGVAAATLARRSQFHQHPRALEALEVRMSAQYPVIPGR